MVQVVAKIADREGTVSKRNDMDFTFGITLKFEKRKKPFAIGQVYYDKKGHLIELHDPEEGANMIRGLIPPYPEANQTPVEPKEEQQKSQETHGVG